MRARSIARDVEDEMALRSRSAVICGPSMQLLRADLDDASASTSLAGLARRCRSGSLLANAARDERRRDQRSDDQDFPASFHEARTLADRR
jgi:hypothetical protein